MMHCNIAQASRRALGETDMSAPSAARPIPHGGRCECELLAAAMGCDSRSISFEFCQRVLQRHWRLECRHGSSEEPTRMPAAPRWKEIGPTDAVKAILISNAPGEHE